MAHTHEYDCKLCGTHLDSKEDLDRHNREHHAANASGSSESSSGFSGSSGSSSASSSGGSINNGGRTNA